MFVQVEPNDEMKKIIYNIVTTCGNSSNVSGTWGVVYGELPDKTQFIPTKIIYNCPATICFFPDGTKEIVKCAYDEEFIKEVGVMSCIMKKIFKSRNAFKKLVETGYENLDAQVLREAHNAPFQSFLKDQWG